ncbi:MAG: hypothetical protein IT337_04915 [Thermomicrobiales bacterium]|nr:hypothetical protein [Thermomicrobiales bacterium]
MQQILQDAAIEFVGAILAALGALLVAHFTLRRTAAEAHADRLAEDRTRRAERIAAEDAFRRRALESLLIELRIDRRAVDEMTRDGLGFFALRRSALDQALYYLPTVPPAVDGALQDAGFRIDSYNTARADDAARAAKLTAAIPALETAGEQLADYLDAGAPPCGRSPWAADQAATSRSQPALRRRAGSAAPGRVQPGSAAARPGR